MGHRLNEVCCTRAMEHYTAAEKKEEAASTPLREKSSRRRSSEKSKVPMSVCDMLTLDKKKRVNIRTYTLC